MKIWLLSDIHLEHAPWQPPDPPDADVLVVAGDIREGAVPALEWLRHESGWRKPIVYVLGNHEFYGSSVERERRLTREYARTSGIHLLDDSSVTIDGVRFVGGTLWTDYMLYANGDVKSQHSDMQQAYLYMRDHTIIEIENDGFEMFEPRNAHDEHVRTRSFIERTLAVTHAGPTIVVTHHAPSPGSIASRFVGDALSAAFASDLGPIMKRYRPAAWLHGHVHSSHDYVVGETRVVCNPRGYDVENKNGFDPGLVIEV